MCYKNMKIIIMRYIYRKCKLNEIISILILGICFKNCLGYNLILLSLNLDNFRY